MTANAPAAGWFADPHDPSQLRWWDGVQWTTHVHPAVAPASVREQVADTASHAQPVGQHAEPRQAELKETVVETYYAGGSGPSMLGGKWGLRLNVGNDDGERKSRHQQRRNSNGRMTISVIDGWDGYRWDEPGERARLEQDPDLTPEQVEACIAAQLKVAGMIEKAGSNPLARKAVHAALTQMAWKTAQGGRGAAMDVLFDGKRYRAQGSRFD